jgi:spore germination cell wall hydrolase CwlJ-like protein
MPAQTVYILSKRPVLFLWPARAEGFVHRKTGEVIDVAKKSVRVLLLRARERVAKPLRGHSGMYARKTRRIAYTALLVATVGIMAAATIHVAIDKASARAAAHRAAELRCLAENTYYEARGEPLVGQYAVAEVTMNRMRSPEFPNSVCEVVHRQGAFSWTYRSEHQAPYGYEWRRAQAVAESVYDNIESPLVNGALFYHATHVSPYWASTRTQVALVGRHIFYL